MEILSLMVLTLTLAAVVFYTIVTRRVQQAVVAQVSELVRQRRLSNMPAFVANVRHVDGADYLELLNIGKGIAINVAIDNVIIRYPSSQSTFLEFARVIRIPTGESVLIKSISEDGEQNKLTFLGIHAHYDADVNIRFQDIEGTKYVQTLRMGRNGYEHGFVKLDESPKREISS
jgi:hypothetical protein